MNRRITDYIQRHRATYTRDALRQMLLQQGYDPAEIEQGFTAVETGQVPPARLSLRFWLVFLGYLVVLYGLTLLLFGLTPAGLFIVPVLAVPLLIAAGISVLIAALSRSAAMGLTGGIVMVFALPFVFLVIIAGSCYALTASFLFAPQTPPPRSGTIDVQLQPAIVSFGNDASCTVSESGQILSISSLNYGEDGTASVDSGSSAGFTASRTGLVTIIYGGVTYQNEPATPIVVEGLSPNGATGTLRFRNLPRIPDGRGEASAPSTVTGRVDWACN